MTISRRVAVVYFPYSGDTIYKFLDGLLEILQPLCSDITVIGGNTERIKVHAPNIKITSISYSMHKLGEISPKFLSIIVWVMKIFLIQISLSVRLIQKRKTFDIAIFYMAYPYFLLPLITTKVLRKKTMEVITRSPVNSKISKFFSLQDFFLFHLLDGISPESENLLKLYGLNPSAKKILPEGARFIDTTRYYVSHPYTERQKTAGFLGRLTKEKGIIEFIDAIRIIAKGRNDISFIIVGTGNLLPWVQDEVIKIRDELHIDIQVTGYLDEAEIPVYLNKFRLLVLPTSHPEGLPTIILEAMFCGTPVLATPVGAIPDIIRDNATGYILIRNTGPELAEKIVELLDSRNMDDINRNALKFVEKKYTYDKAVERWQRILPMMEKR